MDIKVNSKKLQELWRDSQLAGGNAPYVEALYEDYLRDPQSVTEEWRTFFDRLQVDDGLAKEAIHSDIRTSFRELAKQTKAYSPAAVGGLELQSQEKQVRVLQLINAYRFHGHQLAKFNPLISSEAEYPVQPELQIAYHALNEADLDHEFDTGMLAGKERATLREIIAILKKNYTQSIGAEYMHITDSQEKKWLQQRLERVEGIPEYAVMVKRLLLERLTAAEGLEDFLHKKYVGQKRFSLEGADVLIPMMDELIYRAGKRGVKELVIGMAHRGRLNVLVNILGKLPADLFGEFEGKIVNGFNGTGDVKYHQGFSADVSTPGVNCHVSLSFNPSHLEIVGPVVEGSVRARQDRYHDAEGNQVIPVIIHGDAAFAGQGVVMETLNMSQSRGFSTKGTVHIIINNQIGFTTSNQEDARSTLYCTDVAKMVNAPIFHVNGDDPEAVRFITQIAYDYRMSFHKDVVIDLVCYRRHGHSEADEPWVTQPTMYQVIKGKPTPRAIYAEKLVNQGEIDPDEPKQLMKAYRRALDSGHCVVSNLSLKPAVDHPDWVKYKEQVCLISAETGVRKKTLQALAKQLDQQPKGFRLHHSVARIYKARMEMATGKTPVDWGFAETMAYATLLNEGFNVRLSGQDCGRGTFFHRHAVIHDQDSSQVYVPLRNLGEDKGNFLVINSLLSEAAVLAFEYGYSTTDPRTLTLWEAQFGDFANNAQVVIDQFISAGEQKWNRLCGLVMLLPHGFEGQGPEHSSARLERYLQLCAQNNFQVCIPTTAAQIFHLLRQQMIRDCRKPLVIMSPKSLLRLKEASSTLDELVKGQFHPILPETDKLDDGKVKRVIMCHGKVYYDLLSKRREQGRKDVAIIRVEQLYPFPEVLMKNELDRYPNAEYFVWCQEEPQNQGSWFTSQHHVRNLIDSRYSLKYAGRPFSAAPAVGHLALHKEQLETLVNEALGETE